ncbi:MAG: oxidoreductase, partial [Pseudomonadota bacterium]
HAGTRVAILDPGAMRTKMRAKAMPGEDPQTLPSPDDLLPIFFQAIAKDYDGNATRFAMRDWPGN